MWWAEYQGSSSTPVAYTCGRCTMFYYEYNTLLEHLYWKHGTESVVCNTCEMKKWTFAVHKCYHYPNMTTDIGNDNSTGHEAIRSDTQSAAVDINDVEATEVVAVDPNTDPVDDMEKSDSESMSSGDSSYFSGRESKYCYCGKDIEGSEMIGCDNDNCLLEWYHFNCVGIVQVPEGKWYCPECLKLS